MSGIAGAVSTRSEGVEAAVRRMARAMIHRGPDGDGYGEFDIGPESVARGGRVGLAARMHGVAGQSQMGWQPLIHAETGDAIVVDSDIWNTRQLRARLKSSGVVFRGYGDAELLLNALVVFGQAVVDELDGGFAFAFYKASTRRILVCRDPLGIKPLYVASFSQGYVFASEVRAVLASALISEELDPAGVASFLAYGAPQDPLTVHRQIRSVPAGCAEWVDTDAGRLQDWGVATRLSRVISEEDQDDVADSVETLQERLTAAVRDACEAQPSVGVLMLGDEPSAIVGALASRFSPAKLLSFAVGDLGSGDDSRLSQIAEIAHAIKSRHHQVVLWDDWIVQQWRQWMMAADRPSVGGLQVFAVAGAASDLDCRVALSGLGGREMLVSPFAIPAEGALARVTGGNGRSIRAVDWLSKVRYILTGQSAARTMRQRNDFVIEEVARQYRIMNDHDLGGLGFRAGSLGLTPQFLDPSTVAVLEGATCEHGSLAIMAELDLHVVSSALRDADVNSNAHSVAIRFPFLSRGVVRQAARVADEFGRARIRESGQVFASVVAYACPGMSLKPFQVSPPWPAWLLGPLRDECESAIDAVADCPLFTEDSVRQLWRRQVQLSHVMNPSVSLGLVVLGSYLRHAHSRRCERLAGVL